MNVRIFWVLVMECMHAQTRPRFILSPKRDLGYGVRTHANSKGKNPVYRRLKGRSNLWHCIMQDSEPNTLPTELFRPPFLLKFSQPNVALLYLSLNVGPKYPTVNNGNWDLKVEGKNYAQKKKQRNSIDKQSLYSHHYYYHHHYHQLLWCGDTHPSGQQVSLWDCKSVLNTVDWHHHHNPIHMRS